MPDAMTIQLDGKTYSLDDFELGELEWLEDELGAPLDEINPSSMKVAVRFVYLIKKPRQTRTSRWTTPGS